MYEPDDLPRDSETQSTVRTVFGICLIMLGIGVAGRLVFSLVQLLNGGPMLGLAETVMPDPGKPVAIGVPDGEITLPEDVFKPIGMALVIFVYAIIAGVAATLINGGSSLLQPDLAKIMRRMLERLERK